jgi:hypothetical protein
VHDSSERRVRSCQLTEALPSIRKETASNAGVGDRIVARVADELVVLEQLVVRMLREGECGEGERVDSRLLQ